MEEGKQGYVLAVAEASRFYIPGALHVERDDSLMVCQDDEEAAKIAEQDGVKLIYGMEYVPDGVYVDTPENRAAITEGLETYPEYKEVSACSHTLENDEPFPCMGMCFGKG